MKIRADQAQDLADTREFEDHERLWRRVRAFAATTWCATDEPGLRVLVTLSADRARDRGLGRYHRMEYIQWSAVLGHRFDDDPQLTWARPRGRDGGAARAMARLSERARYYVSRVHGARGEHVRAALSAFAGAREGAFSIPPSERFEPFLLATFDWLFPIKREVVGAARLSRLLQEGREDAAALGISTVNDLVIFASLQFLLGYSFFDDPRYDWGRAALAARGPGSPGDRLRRAAAARFSDWLSRPEAP